MQPLKISCTAKGEMVTSSMHTQNRTTVFLFGPQALSFHEAAFNQLKATLNDNIHYRWILNTIDKLPSNWETLSKHLPHLRPLAAVNLLEDLKAWLKIGNFPPSCFPLPNILLTPLVVIAELTQYWRYLELSQTGSRDLGNPHSKFSDKAETVGFCTGLLSAAAVSSSSDQASFEKYGAVAIRLAVLVGALIDAQDASTRSHSESVSFSVAWTSPEAESEMKEVLASFSEVRKYSHGSTLTDLTAALIGVPICALR